MPPTTCDRCARPVYYRRAYSGESLCAACFSESIEEKVRRTISKHSMLRHGERIGVAVSGGKDSLSLLNILSKVAGGHGSELVAITIDEGIEGYREESIGNVRAVAGRLGVDLKVFGYKELFGFTQDDAMRRRSTKISSCAMCGTFRRRAIDVAVARTGVDVLATAHNLDDMVQTFMINLMNGDLKRIGWLGGVAEGSAFRTRRIHPFMEVYEKEAGLYAFANGIPLQSVHCPYMDEGIRSSIRVFLNGMEEAHPGVKQVLLKSALELSDRARVPMKARKCSACGLPSSRELCGACSISGLLKATTV
ncbi:MAG: TIGR00269 family protein [Nitrososphaerota archaeon]|nr:TIGR00269 family protein [Nitrososphaerota archaeon]MDG6939035.1 TIGR00269 family protein [Nitrososphaerota archaeon]